jgi:thiamine transporter ThiT
MIPISMRLKRRAKAGSLGGLLTFGGDRIADHTYLTSPAQMIMDRRDNWK